VKRYEAMFVVDSMAAAKDFQSVRSHIHRILEKASAEIQASDRWDERKLAYDLKGVKRGTYILTYFLCPPENIKELNQQLQLSDVVVRHLLQQREKPIEPPRRIEEEMETREPAEARS
jgi:small subunit ribosomal protein S6